jgi:hypothetical protein
MSTTITAAMVSDVAMFQHMRLRSALGLELKGMRHSQGSVSRAREADVWVSREQGGGVGAVGCVHQRVEGCAGIVGDGRRRRVN